MNLRITIFIGCLLISTLLSAQEILTGTQTNSAIIEAINKGQKPMLKSNHVLSLPFFDDFSDDGVFPNPNNWINNDVYINNDYPVFPVTMGVATFDALDENGLLHPDAGQNIFVADYLTSYPIRLDSVFTPSPSALSASDSIYLSFYYQPEGFGFAPSEGDSLVLEFYLDHPVDSLKGWQKVWSAPGMTLNAFFALHGVYFKRVMIAIKDEAFLRPGFRLRFYNIASIRYPTAPSHQSNRDQWNIDFVYFNRSRTINDIYYNDAAFASKPGSFLRSYQSMPYKQYRQNFVSEMTDSLRVRVSNLSNTATAGSYSYTVSRPNGNILRTYNSGSVLFQPYVQSGFVSQAPVARPPVEFVFPIDQEDITTSFIITHTLQSNDFVSGSNDTITYHQVFSDYYAYDDGTAEAGYGLTNAGGRLAYRFKLNAPDTLTAFNAFFNRTLNNANQKYFNFQVYNDFGGKPGNLIYEAFNFRVEYGINGVNVFRNYLLSDHVLINNVQFPGLVFYIGIEQTTADLLNLGFDRNINSKQYIWYYQNDDWNNTMFDGSLMLRPVLGTVNVAGIPETGDQPLLRVFPNPVTTGVLNLDGSESWFAQSHFQILNLTGTTLLEGRANRQMDAGSLPNGMYLLRITNGEKTAVTRFIIHR